MKGFVAVLAVLVAAGSLWVAPASAGEDDPSIQVRLLLQPQMQLIQAKKQIPGEGVTPDDNGMGQEFFLRRTRIILAGNVNKWIHFFFETDNPNMGRNGAATNTFTQDGFVDFRFYNELKVAMGMILLPFSRHNRQSAASLMGLDYHAPVFTAFGPTNLWRDYGIEARGIVMNHIDYRVGVFRGFQGPAATNDVPRFAGRVVYNVFDVEDNFFYGGTYLGNKKIVALGFGFDVQPEGAVDEDGRKDTYYAFTGDVFVDWPLGQDMAATLNTGVLYYYNGDKKTVIGTSIALFGELGFLWKGLQPVFGFEWAQPMDTDTFKDNQILNFRAGLNYYIKGHNATVKLEYASTLNTIGFAKVPGGPDAEELRRNVVTLGTQLLF
ncbi:MAG: hypothetical protein FJ098_15455 [Deltaproteobacteria bacterium]|nr:hypothetical protein [Deltaproteobacteria bacterium]